MHHSEREESQQIRKLMEEMGQPLGATGKFPQGKLTNHDEGELRLAIGATSDGKVIVDFGKPTAWIGFTPEQAIMLADSLRDKANVILAQTKGDEDK